MGIDQIVPAIMRDQAVAGGEIDALAPFGVRHIGRHFLQACFGWRHDGFSLDDILGEIADFRRETSPADVLQQAAAAAWQSCLPGGGGRWPYGAGMASRLEILRPRMS